jgi:hypothetical protein
MTYAGEHLVTSDEIADLLVELTASLASNGLADAVQIPIYPEGETYPGRESTLEIVRLVVGPGTDLLTVPYQWDGPDPDFSDAATALRSRLRFHSPIAVITRNTDAGYDYEGDFDPTRF